MLLLLKPYKRQDVLISDTRSCNQFAYVGKGCFFWELPFYMEREGGKRKRSTLHHGGFEPSLFFISCIQVENGKGKLSVALFLCSGSPNCLCPLGIYNKGVQSPSYHTHSPSTPHRVSRCLHCLWAKGNSPTMCLPRSQALSALCLLPSAPQGPRTELALWEEKESSGLTSICEAQSVPSCFSWKTKITGFGVFSYLILSNSVVADWPWATLLFTLWKSPRNKDHYSFIFA